ncbi:MAG: YkgJ family cysteine cluster protein [Deltaproteobacteria bacterium]|nr:YkgJ family cysteine cluster protein [Deltaproteobacteria bacterium]MBW2537732.1 YkgJ family cysteine cluster protein [Deltaproteobacteria bacterium]
MPECLECGVCCFSDLEQYLRIWGADYDRLGDSAPSLTVFLGNRCFMRMVDGRCGALTLDVTAGHFVCSVYETRPATCRELRRGSPECAGERFCKGERPARWLRAARRGRRPT